MTVSTLETIGGDFSGPSWLRLHSSNAVDTGSIPGQGTKVVHATQCSEKKKKKKQSGTLGESQGARAEDLILSPRQRRDHVCSLWRQGISHSFTAGEIEVRRCEEKHP